MSEIKIRVKIPKIKSTQDANLFASVANNTEELKKQKELLTKLANSKQDKYTEFIRKWIQATHPHDGYSGFEYGGYDPESNTFTLNEQTLSYDEAVYHWNACFNRHSYDYAYSSNKRLKTTFALVQNFSGSYNYNSGFLNLYLMFDNMPYLESVRLVRGTYGEDIYAQRNSYISTKSLFLFRNCPKVKYVYGFLNVSSMTNAHGSQYFPSTLQEIRIANLGVDISLENSPLLSYTTFEFLIRQRRGTNGITLTVHPDVYDKITNSTNPNYTQWSVLGVEAIDKNIIIASA